MPAVKIHDGSNIGANKGFAAAVKGPNIAATAADEALVVQVSPNSAINVVANTSENIAQWGGTAVTGGTGPGGPGIPRVTVSNDSVIGGYALSGNAPLAVPVAQAVTGTTGATAATGSTGVYVPVAVLDVQAINGTNGYSLNASTGVVVDFYTHGAQKLVVLQTVGTGGTTWTVEGSLDGGVTWQSVAGQFCDAAGLATPTITNSAVSGVRMFEFPASAPRMRIRNTVAGTTLTVVPCLRSQPYVPQNIGTTQLTSNSAASGTTLTRVIAAAGTNATNIKGSAGNLYGFLMSNTTGGPTGSTGSTGLYLKFYNKATAPSVGTDTPQLTVLIPAQQTVNYRPDFPDRFTTGIGYAITSNPQDNDAIGCSVAALLQGQIVTL